MLLTATFGCDQSKPKCAAGRGAFIAQYRPVGGPPSCAALKGEVIGFATYNAEGSERRPNLDVGSIAMQSESLGLLVENAEAADLHDPDPNNKPYAFGLFSTPEPENDFCVVPTLTVARQNLPAVAEDEEHEIHEQEATNQSYEWRNVRIYVTPSAYGTQFTADLTLTTNGVACQYNVIGMYPYVPCGHEDPADPDKQVPDDGACEAEPNVAAGRPTGSGINPDFPTRCDPELLACTLTKDTIPALR